jgi:hypothetical protein
MNYLNYLITSLRAQLTNLVLDFFAALAMTGSRNYVIMEFINKYFLNRDFGIKKPVYFLEKLY